MQMAYHSLSEGAEVKIAKMAFSSSSLLVVRPFPFEKDAPKQSWETSKLWRGQNILKEIGELVANLPCIVK